MRRLLLSALGGLLGVGIIAGGRVIAQQPVNVTNIAYDPCSDPAKVTVFDLNEGAASGNTQLVAISGSTRIYVCSGKIQGGAAGTMYLQFGTGVACVDNADYMDIMIFASANTPPAMIQPGGAGATFYRSAAARALCIFRSTSMTVSGHIRYVQE